MSEETPRTIQLVEGGHLLYEDEDEPGEVDTWRVGQDYHNGPSCAACLQAWCRHCRPDKMTERCEALDESDALDGIEVDWLLSGTKQVWRHAPSEGGVPESGTIAAPQADERP